MADISNLKLSLKHKFVEMEEYAKAEIKRMLKGTLFQIMKRQLKA